MLIKILSGNLGEIMIIRTKKANLKGKLVAYDPGEKFIKLRREMELSNKKTIIDTIIPFSSIDHIQLNEIISDINKSNKIDQIIELFHEHMDCALIPRNCDYEPTVNNLDQLKSKLKKILEE